MTIDKSQDVAMSSAVKAQFLRDMIYVVVVIGCFACVLACCIALYFWPWVDWLGRALGLSLLAAFIAPTLRI